MMKRLLMLCLLLAATGALAAAQTRKPNGDASSGGGNRADGSFTVEGKTYKPAYAYGKLSDGPNDKARPAVKLLFSEKPIARKDMDDFTRLQDKAKAGGTVILQLNIEGGHLYSCSVYNNGETLLPSGFPEDNFDFKAEAWTPTLARASAATKGVRDAFGKKFQFNLSFNVALRKDEWTGAFYTPPPTNLAAGRASGKLTVNGQALKVNYVYATKGFDLFDETQTTTRLLLTEKPLPETLVEASTANRLKPTGNNHEVEFELDDKPPADGTTVFKSFQLVRLDESTSTSLIFNYDTDIIRADGQNLEGRLYTLKPHAIGKSTYELDIAFNAAIKNSPNGPVTASTGSPLPAGGGEPGKAYLEQLAALRQTKTLEEIIEVTRKTSSQAANGDESIEELMKNPKLDTPEKRQKAKEAMFRLLRYVSVLDGPKVTGGFIAGDKATLAVVGTQEGEPVEARVNMHLENGGWKTGAAKIRQAPKAAPARRPVRKAPRKNKAAASR